MNALRFDVDLDGHRVRVADVSSLGPSASQPPSLPSLPAHRAHVPRISESAPTRPIARASSDLFMQR